jgi:hypothetical protein
MKISLFSSARLWQKAPYRVLCIALLLLCQLNVVAAGPREQARRIHDRLAGVPPSASVLDDMENAVNGGNPDPTVCSAGGAECAALIAMENPNFYNVTLKNFVTPWTNEDQTVFADLNDYTATVIGMIRDGDTVPFTDVLSADILYVGDPALGLPAYSNSDNDHYAAMESQGIDLKDNLVRTTQSAVTGLESNATAGVMTTRAAARAFFYAGTNRAMFRFTLMNHLCNDLEQVKDVTRPPDRIRQDVSRSPGGDSRIFLNACIGCHAGMDPMTQAFAYYEWEYDADADPEGDNGQLVYNSAGTIDPDTGTRVQGKYLINANNFEYGYVTTDDSWDNYWRAGPNSILGWDTNNLDLPGSGSGAKSMGVELANSDAFASCQVKKVFETVCLREPTDAGDLAHVNTTVTDFINSNYNMKTVFAKTAAFCKGD